MTSHELARALLAQQDLPVAMHALGHTYHSDWDALTHGPLQIVEASGSALNRSTDQRTIVIGGMVTWRYPDARLLVEAPRPEYEPAPPEEPE